MGALDGRVAIITGAARGLGREHALLFAQEGAKVVVNDLGGDMHGEGGDPHVLVNNAGILRDRVVVNMTEQEWDAVITVHLKGHFAPTHFAAAYWREQTKGGKDVNASIIHTSSTSGIFSNPGQANYGAAKSGIATFSQICAKELVRYGVRSNAICPGARTRLTEATPGLGDAVKAPAEGFDVWDPANVSPFVAYLATADCPFTGETFLVQGGRVQRAQTWKAAERIEKDDRWTVAELAAAAPQLTPRV
jgi:NAD(P)-dependent dehydrogenase (short-subunit alcohol dehydrogenase family)